MALPLCDVKFIFPKVEPLAERLPVRVTLSAPAAVLVMLTVPPVVPELPASADRLPFI